ncbi:MAG: hypothetical protein WA147_08500, partial [Polaromonas sp.]
MKPLESPLPGAPIQVLFALLPGSLVLDWAGPAEALRIANQRLQAQGLPPRFELHFVSPQSETVSSVGLMLAGLAPLPDTLPAPCWVVLVVTVRRIPFLRGSDGPGSMQGVARRDGVHSTRTSAHRHGPSQR